MGGTASALLFLLSAAPQSRCKKTRYADARFNFDGKLNDNIILYPMNPRRRSPVPKNSTFFLDFISRRLYRASNKARHQPFPDKCF